MSTALTSEAERVLVLKTIPAFADLDMYSTRQLGRLVKEKVVSQGTLLLEQGKSPPTCHFLLHDACDVLIDGETVGRVAGPASVGLWALLGGSSARCSVRARRDLVSLSLDKHMACQLWESNFGLMSETLASAASQILEHRAGLPFDPDSPPPIDPGGPIDHPLDLKDKLEVHLDNSFYRNANLEAVAEICRDQDEVRLPAGELLWQTGDEANFFYRIVSGSVEIVRDLQTRGDVGVGHAFGLFESLARRPRTYDARTSRDVVLLRTNLGHFLDVQHDHFELARQLFNTFHAASPTQTSYR